MYANDQRIVVRSVGTSPSAKRKITQADLQWADVLLCTEKKHLQLIQQQLNALVLPKVVILNIPDEYEYMDPELITMLEREIEEILVEVSTQNE